MPKYKSDDSPLNVYDCIRKEFARLNKRIGLAVNLRKILPDQTTAKVEVLDDFKYFDEDWKVFITTAKQQFGTKEVARALKHLDIDTDGDSIRTEFPGT